MELFYVVEFEILILNMEDVLSIFSEIIVMLEFELLILVKEELIDVVRSSEFLFSSFVRSVVGDDFIFVGSDEGFSIFEVVMCEENDI